MIKTLVAAVTMTVASGLAATATADDFPATSSCRPLYGMSIIYNDHSIMGNGNGNGTAPNVICTVKKFSASSGTTLSVTVSGIDANSGTTDLQNLRCRLQVQGAGQGYFPHVGSIQTLPQTLNWATMSVSVTLSAAVTNAWASVVCWLPPPDGTTGNNSAIDWLVNSNF